jgi:AcrR family transcriptional regulator
MSDRPRVDRGSQQRSREGFERIIAAAEDLLDGRDWATISVEDLCLAGEVSPSSFYRRFSSKDAVLDEVHDRWLAGRRGAAQWLADELPWDELSIHEVCTFIMNVYLADRVENSARSLSMFRVQVSHPKLAADRLENDRLNLAAVGPRLAARIDRDVERTQFALMVMASSVLAAVQPPSPFAQLFDWNETQLVAAFVDAFASMMDLDLGTIVPTA